MPNETDGTASVVPTEVQAQVAAEMAADEAPAPLVDPDTMKVSDQPSADDAAVPAVEQDPAPAEKPQAQLAADASTELAELRAQLDAARRELLGLRRDAALTARGLPAKYAPLLGDDPKAWDERIAMLGDLRGSQASKAVRDPAVDAPPDVEVSQLDIVNRLLGIA